MGKYKVEVTYTRTSTKVFEVEASNDAEAIALGDAAAVNFDFNQATSFGEYQGSILERPAENYPADLVEGDTCPECGGTLLEVGAKTECPFCGKFF